MNKKSIIKLLLEGLLIIFSVLFALFINRMAENSKTNYKKQIALESIRKELTSNQKIIESWKTHHTEIRNRISEIVAGQNDSLKNELLQKDYFDLGLLTNNKSLIDNILSSTAWETAKSTNIISEFDYETVQSLTQVYTMQNVITEKSILKILDFYFDLEAHKMENLTPILIQFQLRFWELTGQETLIEYLYKDTIEKLNQG